MILTSLFEVFTSHARPSQRCLRFAGSMLSGMCGQYMNFTVHQRGTNIQIKLAPASNISAISCVTTTPHFFSLDRPVTMLDGYQFTLLMYEATGVTTLKSESRIVAEITPSAVVIRRFLLSQLTQPWSNLRNRREIKGWECWHVSKSKIARRLFLTKFHQRASWL